MTASLLPSEVSPDAAFSLYRRASSTRKANVALLLRELAASGSFDRSPDRTIARLAHLLARSESASAAAELSRALASFGARARPTLPILIRKLGTIGLEDPESFWATYTMVFAVVLIGGAEADRFVDRLEGAPESILSDSQISLTVDDSPTDARAFLAAEAQRARQLRQTPLFANGWRAKIPRESRVRVD